MVHRIKPRVPAGLLMLLGSAALARALFGGPGGDGDDNGDGNTFSSSNSNGFGGQDDFDPNRTMAIHGVLAAVAMVLLFPIGSILVRVLPGRMALWGHVLGQILALVVFIGAVAQGMRLVHQIQIPGQTNVLLTNSHVNYHPIIGLVVLTALLIQPLLGFIHHARFKRLRRRQAWSHLHLWNGRVFVTLGIVNGGLGLKIANASTGLKVAYVVIAAIMWVLWMLAALLGEVRLRRANGPTRMAGPPGYALPEYAPPGHAPPVYREVATGPKPEERSGPRYG